MGDYGVNIRKIYIIDNRTYMNHVKLEEKTNGWRRNHRNPENGDETREEGRKRMQHFDYD